MALRGDKILALDERGELLLIRPNPDKFELLDRKEITASPAWSHIAAAGDEIFVRALKGVTAYRWGSKNVAAVVSHGQSIPSQEGLERFGLR